MCYHQDWLMRQIEMAVAFVARLVFGVPSISYSLLEETDKSTSGQLWEELQALMAAGRLGEAEDLLFANFDRENLNYLRLGLNFYEALNARQDEELEAAGFPREEVEEGLQELVRRWGIRIPEPGGGAE